MMDESQPKGEETIRDNGKKGDKRGTDVYLVWKDFIQGHFD